MPVLVADHHLKSFDEWMEIFEPIPPPVGRWRVERGLDDRNRVYLIVELEPSQVKEFKAVLESDRLKDVISRVNAMSMAPIEFTWMEEVAHGP